MKYAFYTGCVAKGGAPELYNSTVQVASRLGIEFEELVGAACTGAGVLHEKNPVLADTLNARTFAMAERLGLPIMTICSTCQGVMTKVNYRLRSSSEYLAKINSYLADEGLEYKGTTEVKHLLWILAEDIGLEKLKTLVTNPLTDLKGAPFYGCYIVRPSAILGLDDHPGRTEYLDEVIKVMGAEPVDYDGKDKCCGFPILTMNRTNSLSMTAKHVGEAKNEGHADFMVTPCPLCHLNLDGQQPDAATLGKTPLGLPILHLPQALGLAMGIDPKALGLDHHIVSTREVVDKATR